MIRRAHLACVLLVLVAGPAVADYLKASRPVIVHEDHDSDSGEKARLARDETIDLASGTQTDGYYHVLLADGTDGWVYRTFVRRFPGAMPGAPPPAEPDGGVSTPAVGPGALDASAHVSTSCPPEGQTQLASLEALNRLKNRSVGPPPSVVVGTALEDLVTPDADGDDRDRWKPDKAIEIVGYVYDVKKGGVETCNCGATAEADRDTHIEIIADPSESDVSERFIVEVTPTWRRFIQATQGADWSTSALKTSILHKWVKVRGWMLFDSQHPQNAVNTNPNGTNLWRATCWEIHPITALEVVPAPVQ